MLGRQLMIGSVAFLFALTAQGQQRYALLPGRAASTVPAHNLGEIFSWRTWRPTEADIAGLEASLSEISDLKVENWNSSIHIDHPERYFRQYVTVVRAGKKEIYINAFCDYPPRDWATHLHVVLDGGTCYWQALYDPATKRFSHLTANGRA
jgi:hypothetical protein